MSIKRPSAIQERFLRPQGFVYKPEAPLDPSFKARSGVSVEGRPTITVYDYIGDEGFSDVRMAAALRSVGASTDLTIEINSPGGDYFQGVAMFNMLRRHQGHVLVQVMGLAASAASLLAMAGDRIEIAKNAELMVHKAWGMTIGNEEDHERTTETLRHLDKAMAQTYAERSGRDINEVLAWMAYGGGKGTYFSGEDAVTTGFADAIMEVDAQQPVFADASEDVPASLREWDKKLARVLSRAERRSLFNALRGTQDAAAPATQDAGDLAAELYRQAINAFKK